MQQLKNTSANNQAGFGLVETLISLGLMSLVFLVLVSFFTADSLKDHSRFTVQATALIANELEGVRQVPFDELVNRINADFFTELYTIGGWTTVADTTTALSVTPVGTVGTNGLIRVPADSAADYTLEGRVKVDTSSPAGWGAGLVVRAQENDRYYRVVIRASEVALERVEPSGTTVVDTQAYALATNTWYDLKVIISGTSFDIWLGAINVATVVDVSSITEGGNGLIALDGATVRFDDLKVNSTLVTEGDFESTAIATTPEAWEYLEPSTLPTGSGIITVADYGGNSDIREITAVMSWQEDNRNRSITITTLVTQ